MFSYPDAARYRLGTNYQQLPTNAAKSPVYSPFQRDGFMNFGTNYGDDPNYVGSTLKPTTFKGRASGKTVPPTITEHERWVGEVFNYTSDTGPEDFEQAASLWKVFGREQGQQERFIDNVADNVAGVKNDMLRSRVYGALRTYKMGCIIAITNCNFLDLFAGVDENLGARIRDATESKRR
jgi:catalase